VKAAGMIGDFEETLGHGVSSTDCGGQNPVKMAEIATWIGKLTDQSYR
jgi:hypothetical protein